MRHDPAEIVLSSPIKAHNERMTVLHMRAPTGREFRTCGYPFRLKGGGDDGEMITDAPTVSKLISALCDIPLSSVDQLEAVDWQTCYTTIASFLGRTKARTSSTDTTSRPDGGEIPAISGASPSES